MNHQIPDFFQNVKLTGAPGTSAADIRSSTLAVSLGNIIPNDMYACVNDLGGKSNSCRQLCRKGSTSALTMLALTLLQLPSLMRFSTEAIIPGLISQHVISISFPESSYA